METSNSDLFAVSAIFCMYVYMAGCDSTVLILSSVHRHIGRSEVPAAGIEAGYGLIADPITIRCDSRARTSSQQGMWRPLLTDIHAIQFNGVVVLY